MRQKVKAVTSCAVGNRAAGSRAYHLYDSVTTRIIAELEQGRLPWVQPWGRRGAVPARLAA